MANKLVYLGAGALIMYLMDPQSGRRRRADLKNRVDAGVRQLEHGRDVIVRDAANRTHGLLLDTRRAIESRRGGTQLALHGPSLGEVLGSACASWQRASWSPAQRALGGAAGAMLATLGYLRGGMRGYAWCALGGALLARATANERISTLVQGKGIYIERTVRIAAPVEEVFAYWRNLENFPLWMSHVRSVRYVGGDRFHWEVDGPAGRPVQWESELLNVSDNREMTWRAVEGSQVDHTGRVRFEPEDGATRVHVQLRYRPPGGVLGHAVARAFGTDPGAEMDDDLGRLQALIESGRAPREAAAPRFSAELPPGTPSH
jgi:uncharacterized membrane protein